MTGPARSARAQLLGALAFAGDLSMGQPVDHSPRAALLAMRLGTALDLGPEDRAGLARLALLRWAGCTANAREFADLFGDDISGRAALIADQNPFVSRPAPTLPLDALVIPLAVAHCEASAEIARQSGFGEGVEKAVLDIFEWWDGTGFPRRRAGEAIDLHAQLVSLSGDVEVLVRIYGLAKGLAIIQSRAGKRYDAALVRLMLREAPRWLADLGAEDPWTAACAGSGLDEGPDLGVDRMAEILADFADLKMPQAAGGSRRLGELLTAAARPFGVPDWQIADLELAGLLHGLGRVSVSNQVLERTGPLSDADREQVRLAPYWTARILSRTPVIQGASGLASQAFERLDGSGCHRGLAAAQLEPAARLLQSGVVLVALLSERPWRPALSAAQAKRIVEELVAAGRLEARAVSFLLASIGQRSRVRSQAAQHDQPLTDRERGVLTLLARGHSNKAIARTLEISPSTAGTHVENIYRKLAVSTRAAATLKAASLGVLAR